MKEFIRNILNKFGYKVYRVPQVPPDLEAEYIKGGRIPWSLGYYQTRERFISRTLGNSKLMDAFRKGRELPKGFGAGFDERCVEYPWLLAHLKTINGKVLDAGSTLNHIFLLDHPFIKEKSLDILTLAPESTYYCERGISYIFADLRNIPIKDNYYEEVFCISTLEHVGFDNTLFVPSKIYREHRPSDFLKALLEMRRVLKPGGRLFLTVPYGKYRDFGTFQLFDSRLIDTAIEKFNPKRIEKFYFLYTREGWNISDAHKCGEATYVEWVMLPPKLRPNTFPRQPDNAAAARSVACLLFIK